MLNTALCQKEILPIVMGGNSVKYCSHSVGFCFFLNL